MPFMQPQYENYSFGWLTFEDECGEYHIIPGDMDPSDVGVVEVHELERVFGWCHRLSASGFLDCTDWSGPFPNLETCKEGLKDTWDVDPETGEMLDGD